MPAGPDEAPCWSLLSWWLGSKESSPGCSAPPSASCLPCLPHSWRIRQGQLRPDRKVPDSGAGGALPTFHPMAALSLGQLSCWEKLGLTSSVAVTGFHIWYWGDVVRRGNKRTRGSIPRNISPHRARKDFPSDVSCENSHSVVPPSAGR